MKNDRLFGIVYLLLSRDTMTAKELAEYFEVSVRTIYRDIDLLSSFHIPIYASKGKNGGIRILENYKLDKIMLTEEEQKEILFSLQSIDALNLHNYSLFDKMRNLFQASADDWFEIDFNVWNESDTHRIIFESIKRAILTCHVIEFLYFNSYGETSKRVVEPIQLHFKYNAWYLDAFDRIKNDFRVFKLLRMKNLVIQDISFDRKKLPKEIIPTKTPKLVKMVLEINQAASYRVYDEFEEDTIQKLENGNFRVELELPENDWLYGYLLSFGDTIKVLEPTYLREIILEKLTASLKNYQ